MVTAWPCFYEQLPSGCAEEMFRLAIELLQLCNYPLAIKAILLDIKQDERGTGMCVREYVVMETMLPDQVSAMQCWAEHFIERLEVFLMNDVCL